MITASIEPTIQGRGQFAISARSAPPIPISGVAHHCFKLASIRLSLEWVEAADFGDVFRSQCPKLVLENEQK